MIKFRAILGRRLPLLVLATLLGAGAGLLSAWNAPDKTAPVYDVTQIIVSNPGAQTSNIQQDSIRVTRGIVADRAASLLGRGGEGPELGEVGPAHYVLFTT